MYSDCATFRNLLQGMKHEIHKDLYKTASVSLKGLNNGYVATVVHISDQLDVFLASWAQNNVESPMNAIAQVEVAFFLFKIPIPEIFNKLTHQVMAALSLVEQINGASGPIKDLLLIKVLANFLALNKLNLFFVLFF